MEGVSKRLTVGAVWTAGGRILANLLGMLNTLALARLLTPDERAERAEQCRKRQQQRANEAAQRAPPEHGLSGCGRILSHLSVSVKEYSASQVLTE